MKFVVAGVDITENPYTFTPTANTTVTAQFEVVTPPTPEYTVTVEVNPAGAGTVTGAGTVAEGESVTLTATANEGYNFVKFVVEGTDITENPYTFTPEADVTVIAQFDAQTLFDITIAETENGTITAPANAAAGETVTVTTTPDEGYVLVTLFYYTTDPTEVTNIDLATLSFEMPEADITIGATFVSTDNKGDVNGDGNINIIDVLATLNYILEKDPQPFIFEQADMNEDGIIDISDAMTINAMILGMKGECEDATAVYEVVNGQLFIDSEIALAGYQFRLSAEPAVIDMPGFTAVGNWSNGEYIFLVYSLNSEKEAGTYAILDLGNANVNDVVMATREGCRVRGIDGIVSVNDFNENSYSIFPVPAYDNVKVTGNAIQQVEVFNAMGQLVMTVNNINADETEVNVSKLTAGSYLFRINAENGVATKNVIVIR